MATQFCRHIRINGERCGSPALRSETFCYYHIEVERRHRRTNPRSASTPAILHPMTLQDGVQRDPMLALPVEPLQLDFPPLEDRHSIQLALSVLINALAQDRIDPKRAALIFYGLQIASSNARTLDAAVIPDRPALKVRTTVLDEASGTQIAPDEDPEEPEEILTRETRNSAYRFLEEFLRQQQNQAAETKPSPPAQAEQVPAQAQQVPAQAQQVPAQAQQVPAQAQQVPAQAQQVP